MLWGLIKKKKVPQEERTEIDVFESWTVRWTSRNGQYPFDTRPEMEIFPSKESAAAFKRELEEAFKLIKHTGHGTTVIMSKND